MSRFFWCFGCLAGVVWCVWCCRACSFFSFLFFSGLGLGLGWGLGWGLELGLEIGLLDKTMKIPSYSLLALCFQQLIFYARHDKTRQDTTSQDKTRQDKTRQGSSSVFGYAGSWVRVRVRFRVRVSCTIHAFPAFCVLSCLVLPLSLSLSGLRMHLWPSFVLLWYVVCINDFFRCNLRLLLVFFVVCVFSCLFLSCEVRRVPSFPPSSFPVRLSKIVFASPPPFDDRQHV